MEQGLQYPQISIAKNNTLPLWHHHVYFYVYMYMYMYIIMYMYCDVHVAALHVYSHVTSIVDV